MNYKCIPAPSHLYIDSSGSCDAAVRSFADLINREANNGWEFHSMQNIAVTQQPGCLARLFGKTAETQYFNMLIFSYGIAETRNTSSVNSSGLSNLQNENKCKKCGKTIGSGYKSCPHCGYSEISRPDVINKTPVILPKIKETKKCKKCGNNIDSDEFKCPNCKGNEFV